MNKLLPIHGFMLILLTGCISPRDICIAKSKNIYKKTIIEKQITEANLQRGYAVHKQSVPYEYEGQCQDEYLEYYKCRKIGYRIKETPVSIDLNHEEKKLKKIREKLALRTSLAIEEVLHTLF